MLVVVADVQKILVGLLVQGVWVVAVLAAHTMEMELLELLIQAAVAVALVMLVIHQAQAVQAS